MNNSAILVHISIHTGAFNSLEQIPERGIARSMGEPVSVEWIAWLRLAVFLAPQLMILVWIECLYIPNIPMSNS